MGEMFGLEPGTTVTYQMNTALKRMGFKHVFDTNFAADLTSARKAPSSSCACTRLNVGCEQNVALPSSPVAPRDG